MWATHSTTVSFHLFVGQVGYREKEREREELEKAGIGKIKGTLSRKFATLMEVICGSSVPFPCLSNTRHECVPEILTT